MDPEHIQRTFQQAQLDERTVSALQQTARNFQRPEMQEYLRNLQQPAMQELLRSLSRFQDVMKQQAAISQFRLPPTVFRAPISINKNAIWAAVEAANSAYAAQLRKPMEKLAQSLSVSLSPEALASAQYATVQRFAKSSLPEAVREIAQSTAENIQARYTESLRQTAELLSDVNVKRMIELAVSEELIEEALESAQETDSPLKDILTAEDVGYPGLDPNSAVDTLLPYISWAIIVFSVALVMTFSNPSYQQYKEPLTKTVLELTILERALKAHKKYAQEDQEE